MKSSSTSAHLDDAKDEINTLHPYPFYDRSRSLIETIYKFIGENNLLLHHTHFMSSIFKASKNISGLEKVELTSPAWPFFY